MRFSDTELIDVIKQVGYKKRGNQTKIAELLGASQGYISQRINQLIEQGLIDENWYPIVQDRIAKPTPVPAGYESHFEREARIRKKLRQEIKAEVMKKIENLLFPE